MTTPRFTLDRACNGSMTIRDAQLGGKVTIVVLRALDLMPAEQAEAAAKRKAEICAAALNHAHEARERSGMS